jgi:hypothetical protein
VSRHERFDNRDRTYSNWHRYACADSSPMIDVDGLDYCRRCRMPLLLIEAARDVGQAKPTLVLQQLAQAANVPALCVLWTPSVRWSADPPHCLCQLDKTVTADCDHGVLAVRVRRVWPEPTSPTDYTPMTPEALARYIDEVHAAHERTAHAFGAVA